MKIINDSREIEIEGIVKICAVFHAILIGIDRLRTERALDSENPSGPYWPRVAS
jgi:hypothetical protein